MQSKRTILSLVLNILILACIKMTISYQLFYSIFQNASQPSNGSPITHNTITIYTWAYTPRQRATQTHSWYLLWKHLHVLPIKHIYLLTTFLQLQWVKCTYSCLKSNPFLGSGSQSGDFALAIKIYLLS